MMTLTLQEVLIVGSCSEQVKFSELTLDMFRMLQTLEREPQEDMAQMYDQSPAPGRVPFVSNLVYDTIHLNQKSLSTKIIVIYSLYYVKNADKESVYKTSDSLFH